mmetsp:Transcript_8929/g.13166  ORF Transcript_8929/g.13166 Transcript_8929/m.13166 type:complete len:259 (+) Transcript_8929:52-828(+)|eukprot:CAMPEP_0196815856 /NCGR_PEP_ID=MMETSP1362-20130617/52377_1 /TAXON_ID=163516 /ORGANISM="Leptocylindrus danicus, Strain CCMP1856" /LENGTH=258 /DNA_ID=CAMNT_0042192993 /DNA_START=37 /DNA_END=813 /DNA_ORIENTATION=-
MSEEVNHRRALPFKTQLFRQEKLLANAKASAKQSGTLKASLKSSVITKQLAKTQALLNIDDSDSDSDSDSDDEEYEAIDFDADFESKFKPEEMRCFALVAHNHMKPAMKEFVLAHKNLLKKFRLTGTNTTMSMLREVFGNDPNVVYGPTCSSGPLGGDAELVALMCTANLGGMVFFVDPMDAHPHAADIACLNRQANVHNIFYMNNPASAHAGTHVLRTALKEERTDLIPSFFFTLKSPSVQEYQKRQKAVLNQMTGK